MTSEPSTSRDTGESDQFSVDVRDENAERRPDDAQVGRTIQTYSERGISLTNEDVAEVYESWESPKTIVSDGAYGTGSFPTEPEDTDNLESWYRPHVEAWSEHATPETTLWLWNTEGGWAEIHSLLKEYGWEYRGCNIWDKGIAHIAGNSNTQKLRKFPQVTEVCVQYIRSHDAVLELQDDDRTVQEWLRDEWERSGLSFAEANKACGVSSAATRKYFATGTDWYFPPPERFKQLREYANTHGNPDGRPYLSPDGLPFDPDNPEDTGVSAVRRGAFDCPAGVTNVWSHPQVSGDERITNPDGSTTHPNQKPLELIRRLLRSTTDENDVVWEPFGGLCTTAVAAKELSRTVYASEIVEGYYDRAVTRLQNTCRGGKTDSENQAKLEHFD